MPNFVSVDTKPFHPETYMGPEQEDEEFQGENIREKSMSIKLKVENTLRWRWTKEDNGQDVCISFSKSGIYNHLIFNHRNESRMHVSYVGPMELSAFVWAKNFLT